MFNSRTLTILSGFVPPDDVLKDCLLEANYVGLTYVMTDKDKKPFVMIRSMPLSALPDQFKSIQDFCAKLKDKNVVVHFGNLPEGVNKEEMQPLPAVFGEHSLPLIAAIMTDIEGPREKIGSHLQAKLLSLYNASSRDMEKLCAKLKDKSVGAELVSGLNGGGQADLKLITSNDRILVFGASNASETEAPEWGYDDKYVAPTAEAEVEVDPLAESLPSEEVDPLADAPIPQVEPAGKPVVQQPQTQKTTATPTKLNAVKPPVATAKTAPAAVAHPEGGTPVGFVRVQSPKNINRESDLLKWMKKKVDSPPKDYWSLHTQGKLYLLVPEEKKPAIVKDLKDLGNSTATVVGPKAAIPATAKVVSHSSRPDKANVTLPATATPLLSVEHRKSIVDEFLPKKATALLDKNSEAILDPSLLKDYEEKFADIAEQLGLPNIEVMHPWSVEDYVSLGNVKYGDGLALVAFWTKVKLIEAQQELYKLTKGKQGIAPAAATSAPKVAPVAAARPALPRVAQQRRAS